MEDRQPKYPGRVELTDILSGVKRKYDMVMADEPLVEGTSPTKGNLLSDQTAASMIYPSFSRFNVESFGLSAHGANRFACSPNRAVFYDEYIFGGIAIVTEDGITFEKKTLSPIEVNRGSYTYALGKFWNTSFVSTSVDVRNSDDGINWEQVATVPGKGYIGGLTLAYGNGVFVSTGTASYSGGKNQILTSQDGINWSVVSVNFPLYPSILKFLDGKFYALLASSNNVKEPAYVAISENGQDWEVQELPEQATWMDIAYGNGKLVVVSTNPYKVAITFGGNVWHTKELQHSMGNYVTFSNNVFMSITGNMLLTSADGEKWSVLPISYGPNAPIASFNGVDIAISETFAYTIDSQKARPETVNDALESLANLCNGLAIFVADLS